MSDIEEIPKESGRLRKISTSSKSDHLVISDASSLSKVKKPKQRRRIKVSLNNLI